MLEEFLQRPHQRAERLSGRLGDTVVTVADFTRLPTQCKFLAFMPQWDFLSFLTEKARAYPSFSLRMPARVEDVLWDGARVAGVRAQTPDGPLEVRAALTVAADGRDRRKSQAHLQVQEVGAPMDVLWLRLTKLADDPDETFGYIRDGRILAPSIAATTGSAPTSSRRGAWMR